MPLSLSKPSPPGTRPWVAYLAAMAAVAAAVLLRWILDPLLGDGTPFITAFGAVAIAVWVGGYPPALVATNWTRAPHWLVSPSPKAAVAQASPEGDKLPQRDGQPVAEQEPETGAPSGVIM